MVIKHQWRLLKKSKTKWYDFLNLLHAFISKPKNIFISANVRFRNKGHFKPTSPFYFDIFVNRLTWATSDRGVFKIQPSGSVVTGKKVRISGGCRLYVTGKLAIGDNTYINPNSIIIAHNEITIGDNCAISWKCQIMDTDMHHLVIDGKAYPNSLPIKIGDNVWVGSGCTILKGVTIGNGAVVAAGSVVTKNVASKTLVGGVPARVLKEYVEWMP